MAWLAFGWCVYFLIHSLLASMTVKRWVAARFPAAMAYYRLGFNLLACVTLVPVLLLAARDPGPLLWAWQGPWAWLRGGLTLAAVAGVVWSARFYDGRAFLGLRQWALATRSVEDQEVFRLSPLHRFVRHPWYFLGLVLIWGRDMNAATLVSTLLLTAYLVVGSRLEENKLMVYHGEVYRQYRRRVAGLVPLPWKRLSAAEARALVARSRRGEG